MSGAPFSALAVLEGTPIAGTVEEIEACGLFMKCVQQDAEWYAQMVRAASGELDALRSAAVSQLQTKIVGTLEPGGRVLADAAAQAKRACERYAAEVDRIHRTARRIRDTVEELLSSIRRHMAEIDEISEAIGVRVSYTWQVGAPAQMPEPVLDARRAAGLLAEEREIALRALRNAYAEQWFRAASFWQQDVQEISEYRVRWSVLITEREQAERAFLSALNNTAVGQLVTLSVADNASLQHTVAIAIAGELRGSASGALQMGVSHPLLRQLIAAESGAHIWDSPPDPALVAENWAKLSEAEQATLIHEVPWVIGNLPGLPFDIRAQANNLTLQYYAMRRGLLGAESRQALDGVLNILADDGEDRVPTRVVALDLHREVPMVVLGYGDLTPGARITWQVPGMNNDAHRAIKDWDQAGRELYLRQERLTDYSGTARVGVLTFLSYDTPDLSDTMKDVARLRLPKHLLGGSAFAPPDASQLIHPNEQSVLHAALARQGAIRLAAELDGTWAVQHREGSVWVDETGAELPGCALGAHSYGTTTAANALTLTRHPVAAFTMLGSAGLDAETVHSLEQLHVAEIHPGQKAIYTAHAQRDLLARIGIVLSGRANPNADWRYPTNENYSGACFFSAEGTVTASGEVLNGTDGHSVLGSAEEDSLLHRLGVDATAGGGYWDRNTQALHNLAATTLGLESQVEGELICLGQR